MLSRRFSYIVQALHVHSNRSGTRTRSFLREERSPFISPFISVVFVYRAYSFLSQKWAWQVYCVTRGKLNLGISLENEAKAQGKNKDSSYNCSYLSFLHNHNNSPPILNLQEVSLHLCLAKHLKDTIDMLALGYYVC